jgi:hypothetical protein
MHENILGNGVQWNCHSKFLYGAVHLNTEDNLRGKKVKTEIIDSGSVKCTIMRGKILYEETLNGSFIVFLYFITS